jgi:predicted DCC family thiol-disulfide oxidoreductase YuxK
VSGRPTLLYDGDCRFCRFVARVLFRLDLHERIAFLSIREGVQKGLLDGLTGAQQAASIHLVEPDGRRRSAGAAFARLLEHLGVPAPLARLVGSLYGPVAHARGILGRVVPDGPGPKPN